jgi:hypothetical protein
MKNLKAIIFMFCLCSISLSQGQYRFYVGTIPESISQSYCSAQFRYYFSVGITSLGVQGSIDMPDLGAPQSVSDCPGKTYKLEYFKVKDISSVEIYYVFLDRSDICAEGCQILGWTTAKAIFGAKTAPSYTISGKYLRLTLEDTNRSAKEFGKKTIRNRPFSMYYAVVLILRDGRRLRARAEEP